MDNFLDILTDEENDSERQTENIHITLNPNMKFQTWEEFETYFTSAKPR
jgi:hypothetical protein